MTSTMQEADGRQSVSEAMPLQGDSGASVRFLKAFHADDPWVLTALVPDGGKPDTETFGPNTAQACQDWIDSHQGINNIYFMVNPPMKPMAKKAARTDVKAMTWLHVDADPRAGEDRGAERERILAKIKEFKLSPTVIVDSGGGYQAFWRLVEAVPVNGYVGKCEELEAYNIQLSLLLDGDHCHTLEHLMRLPGTINVPDSKKKKKGRVAALARVVSFKPDLVYPLDRFEKAPGVGTGVQSGGDKVRVKLSSKLARVESVDVLPVSQEVKMLIVQGCDPDEPTRWESRSELLFYVVCEMVRAGVDDDIMASVIMDQDFRISDSVLDKPHPEQYAARQIQQAHDQNPRASLPVVWVQVGDEPRMLDDAEAALIKANIGIYQCSGRLVRVRRLGASGTGALSMLDVTDHWLRENMAKTAQWICFDAKNGEKPTTPKLDYAKTYLCRVGEWRVPELKAIIQTPTILLDGTVIDQEGYHTQSGLLLDCGSTVFPQVPERPTKEDAEAALNTLTYLLQEFPFVRDNVDTSYVPDKFEGRNKSISRSVALAAILTGTIRADLPSAPMFGFDATTKGTGKSYIVELIHAIVSGGEPKLHSWNKDDKEVAKALASALRGAPSVIHFDNVDYPIKGEAICTILTSKVWASRILGVTKDLVLSTTCLFTANGNGLIFAGGVERRVVVCCQNAKCEKPGERDFEFRPVEKVKANRGQYVVAALTILRAYIVAGRPLRGTLKTMASFEGWSVVREALVWLDQPDPKISQDRVMAADFDLEDLRDIHDLWNAAIGDRQMRLRDVVEECYANEHDSRHRRLLHAFGNVSGSEKMNVRKLGWWFTQVKDQIADGRHFEVVPKNKRNEVKLVGKLTEDASKPAQAVLAGMDDGWPV
jgi:hypothetical protein